MAPLAINPITGLPDLTGSGGGSPTTPGGADGAVQYNNGGAFGGFGTFDDGANSLLLPGSVGVIGDLSTIGTLSITDDANFDAGLFVATDVLAVRPDLASGRVGVNNVNPTVEFDVTGSGRFSQNLDIDQDLGVGGTFIPNAMTVVGLTQFQAQAKVQNEFWFNTSTMTLADGNNDAVALPSSANARISGPTGAFAIRGIIPPSGADGTILFVVNLTGQAMTLTHQAGGTAARQLTTSTGADIVTTGNGWALLMYDFTSSKWLVMFHSA